MSHSRVKALVFIVRIVAANMEAIQQICSQTVSVYSLSDNDLFGDNAGLESCMRSLRQSPWVVSGEVLQMKEKKHISSASNSVASVKARRVAGD